MTTPLKRIGRSPIVAYAALLIVLMFGMTAYQRSVTNTIRESQLAGCERGKLDRTANAAGWTAELNYKQGVLAASSVKGDVKREVRKAIATYRWISKELTERAQIDCAAAFPKP